VSSHLAKFNLDGVDLAPKDARERAQAIFDQRYDEQLAADLRKLDADEQATEAGLVATLEASMAPPKTRDDTHALLLLRMFEGQTFDDLLAAYTTTTDADDPTLIALVENNTGRLWQLFRLQNPGEDSVTTARKMFALNTAVTAKREARKDQRAAGNLDTLRAFRSRMNGMRGLMRDARANRKIQVAGLRRSHHSHGAVDETKTTGIPDRMLRG
jgi:hypothetical protein